jgi:redox-sensitive bicupin YhaK (pirin superfamily)
MPEQENGLLEGFQLWVNLPAAHKMDPPRYQEYPASRIPLETRAGGAAVRVVAGTTSRGTRGPVVQPLTEPLYLDVRLPAGGEFVETTIPGHNAFVYVIYGPVVATDTEGGRLQLERDDLGILAHGDAIILQASDTDARFLVVAGKPLNEPVARSGPFVMNTQAEIQQAYQDYEQGRF